MAVDRLVGVDHTVPRLPQSVIDASKGTTAADLAAGDTLAAAMAYADSVAGGGGGGGGGGSDIVSLTQAEYNALTPPDPDTIYVITDAASASDPLTVGTFHATGGAEIDGTLDHDGTAVGFFGAAPAARPTSVTARAALEALGLGATLTADPAFANNDTTLTGTSSTLAVTPAGHSYASGRLLLNDFGGTAYTLLYQDAGKLITTSNGAAVTVTVPPASSVPFEAGTHIDVAQLGAGQVTVVAGAGVTVNGTPGLKARARYSRLRLQKLTAADTWLLSGDSSA